MKVTVDRETCIGCRACASICPAVFKMKEGKAHAEGSAEEADCVQSAADSCPVQAIEVEG